MIKRGDKVRLRGVEGSPTMTVRATFPTRSGRQVKAWWFDTTLQLHERTFMASELEPDSSCYAGECPKCRRTA